MPQTLPDWPPLKPNKPKTLSQRTVERHEALFPRLADLAQQVHAMAARRPDAAVPEPMYLLAETALFEAQPFRPQRQRRDLVMAANHYAPLAVQLGAALADLVAFEQSQSRWDDSLNCPVWLVAGPTLPVRRLQGRAPARKSDAKPIVPRHSIAEMRKKLAIRIDQFKRR